MVRKNSPEEVAFREVCLAFFNLKFTSRAGNRDGMSVSLKL
jgi:hypothetical protein